ncbi:MAG: TonB family protein [Thermodesulfobacteriota bacterium]
MSPTWENREEFDANGMRWSPVIILSVLFHAALISLIFFVPESLSIRTPGPPGVVYEVQLVDMPGPPAGSGESAPAAKEASPPSTPEPKKDPDRPALVQAPEPTKRISEIEREEKPVVVAKKTVKEKTTPVKKPEVSPSERIDQAISRIDRKVKSEVAPPKSPETRGDHLERAMADLQSRAGRQPGAVQGGTGGGGRGGFLGTAMQIYRARVQEHITANWSYPAALQSRGNPEATILLRVQRDGTITSSRLVKRSTNSVFDDSVLRAVERSDPLPPFPESYKMSREEFEIRFTLKEMEHG